MAGRPSVEPTPPPPHAADWRPPRTRRGRPGGTPLAILSALLAGARGGPQPGSCVLCRRRPGRPRLISPTQPSLAALILPEADRVTRVCPRCGKSRAVAGLIALEGG
jgi:hypothetical protein